MQYHCKICGSKLQGTETECPGCHTPLGPATRMAESGSEQPVATDEITARPIEAPHAHENEAEHAQGGIQCPRCGEMLMPGANVCEVCGEVIVPPNRELPFPKPEMPESAPETVTAVSVVPDLPSVPTQKRVEVPEPEKKEGHSQVSVNMLVVICVMTALIAGLVTWAIFYFSRKAKAEQDTTDDYTEQVAEAPATPDDIGAAQDPALTAVEQGTAPATATPAAVQASDANAVPIEGMRESLAGSWMFYGKINNRFSIGIDLKVEPDGTVAGSYWYESTMRQQGDVPSTYVALEGEVDDTGRVKMTAFRDNKPVEYWTGHFSGVSPLVLKGTFRNASTGTTYTFATSTR